MMKLAKHTRTAVFSAALLATVLPGTTLQADAASDAAEIQALREQIILLQKRLDAIEAREAAVQAKVAAAPAQATAPAPAAPVKPSPDTVTAKLNSKGLSLSTADGNYTFHIKTRLQADAHFFPDSKDGKNDATLRRAILSFRGSAGKYMNWVFSPNFGGSSAVVDDAWIEIVPSNWLKIDAGKIQSFEGLENIQSNAKLLFAERGLQQNLAPSREIGAKIMGKALGGLLNVNLAVVDAALDGTNMNTDANLSGDLGLAANITLTPFASDKDNLLSGLAVGFSASTAKEKTTIDSTNSDRTLKFKTAGRGTFLTVQNGTALDGDRSRLNPQLYYYHGPFGLLADYIVSSYDMTRGGVKRSISNSAWTAQASWVLTGEKASFSGVKPARPFAFGAEGGWGAWEVGARINAFNADKDLFSGDSASILVSSSSVQKASAWGLVIKWYLTENLLWALNFEETDFSGLGANRSTEDVITTRLQIDF